jgi:hypothetical protein
MLSGPLRWVGPRNAASDRGGGLINLDERLGVQKLLQAGRFSPSGDPSL